MSRTTHVLDDLDCDFLHSAHIPDVPCTGSWVQIIQPGIYKGDLAVVSLTPSTGDIVMIAVVPHFRNKKRKSKGNARPAQALLDPKFVVKFSSNEHNIHYIRSHKFTTNGLELLQVAGAHGLKIEPCPSEGELLLFQSSFGIVDKNFELDLIIQHAVNETFCNKSRRSWHLGDGVQIVEGAFVDMTCSICEIDEDNQSIFVEFNLLMLTRVEVSLGDLEQ